MNDNDDHELDKLSTRMTWIKTDNAEFPYANEENEGADYLIRLNDFPEEPLYTLIKNDKPLCSFNNWPDLWEIS